MSGAFRPTYSETMEDYDIVGPALKIGTNDVVFSVASAGDNVFHAAMDGARLVLGVDIAADQIELCRIKHAAMTTLEWSEFARLLGTTPSAVQDRARLLGKVLEDPRLASLRQQWSAPALVGDGLASCGALSLFMSQFRQGLYSVVPADVVRRTIVERDANARAALFATHFATPAFIGFLEAALNEQTIAGAFVPAWAFSRMLEQPFAKYFYEVLRTRIVESEPAANFFLQRILLGTFLDPGIVPAYLQRDRYDHLRAASRRISWHVGDALSVLRTLPDASVDAFNLSNILDWCEAKGYEALWLEVTRAAAVGARLFLRSFVAGRDLPAVDGAWRKAEAEAEAETWHARDRVGYYSRYELWTRAAT
jgi:S-adenosylmethionine-diacylglycerol 3-amino-3-carboxypropyl transferase